MKRSVIFFIALMVVICFFVFFSSYLEQVRTWLNSPVPGIKPEQYTYRDMATYKDFWLNGYLGLFFRFKYMGNLNWLAIPLFLHFVSTIRKRQRWEIAICFVFVLSVVALSITGYTNYRYQATLFPFTISIIMLQGWDIIIKRSVSIRVIVFVAVFIMICINCNNTYLPKKFRLFNKSNNNVSSEVTGRGRGSSKLNVFPGEIIRCINDIKDMNMDDVILECNVPIVYYYTTKKGLYYLNKPISKPMSDFYTYYPKGQKVKALKILKNEAKVKYILTRTIIEEYMQSENLLRFKVILATLKNDCDLICEDKGYKLYRIKD